MFFDIEKEEKWLNEQLQKGYRCTNINGFGIYTFEETDNSYVIRLDCQEYMSKRKSEEYIGLHEDFGWTYLKGSWLGGIRYWQKEAGNHNEIFSDRQSKGNYYKRVMNYCLVLGMFCLIYSFMLFSDQPTLYFDGLWSMEGSLFCKALIFETPFVLLKLLPVFMAIIFGISYYKAYQKHSILKE